MEAETAAAIRMSAAEKRELQSIQEEAQRGSDVLERSTTAAHKYNREREVQTQTDYKGQAEGVNALISGESKTLDLKDVDHRLSNKPAGSPSGCSPPDFWRAKDLKGTVRGENLVADEM